jgi:YVTN family beta-propeller protein
MKSTTTWHGVRAAACGTAALFAFALITLPAGAAALAYIPNHAGATVAVVDTTSGAVITTVPVGAAPIGVAVAPGGRHAYVAQHGSNTVAVISTNTFAVLAQIPVGSKPMGVALSPDGSRLYVTNFGTAAASGPGSLWVNGSVSVIDTQSRTQLASVTAGANPSGIAVSPDGGRIFVANAGSASVSVISAATNTVASTINVESNPVGVATSPDGQSVYVGNSGSASLSVINANTLTVAATIRVGGYPAGVAVSDNSSRILVANSFDNSISVVDAATQAVAVTTSTGAGSAPAGVAFLPGGSTAVFTSPRGSSASLVNATNGSVSALTASGLGWPYSLGKFVSAPLPCALDVSGDTLVTAASDGLLIVRYVLGFRGAALTQGVSGIASGETATTIEQSIASLSLDADGDGVVRATTDGLLLVRAMLGLSGTGLIGNARNSAFPGVRSANQILQWVSDTHGSSCLL